MKKLTIAATVVVLVFVGIAVYTAFQLGEPATIFASGRVELAEGLSTGSANTLFITIFDADSQMPMPFGALRTTLSGAVIAGTTLYEFVLTPDNTQLMNPNAPLPKRLRLKARLDQDGQGGSDQSGDLFGVQNDVSLGQEHVVIKIDQQVE